MSEGGWIVALWALMLPIVMTVLLIVPPYSMSVLALWNVYGDQVLSQWHNFGYVVRGMEQLYEHWQSTEELTVMDYFIPVFAPVLFGFALSLFLMYRFYRYIRNVFTVT